MAKIKIGILVLTDKIKDRMTRKNNHFDSLEYAGIKYIASEIERDKYEVEYCSVMNLEKYDFVLVSLISFMDVFNLISELKNKPIKTRLITGGATLANIHPIKEFIWAACFGRGELIINDIFNQKEIENVWYKDHDPDIKGKYKIGQQKVLINIDGYKEQSVGCPNKCKFCQYSWKHRTPKGANYTSGMDTTEELFKYLDWKTAKARAITAIDGTTEKTRRLVNKKLTNQEIYKKLLEVYELDYNKPLYLKIFNIVGFPWENDNLNFDEIAELFRKADKNIKTHRVWVKIFNNHFKPMPLTPLALAPVSKINYREKFKNKRLYMGNNFEVLISPYSTSPATACEETLINRAYDGELLKNIYTTRKYLNLNVSEKIKVIEKYSPEVFEWANKLPIDYLESPFNIKYLTKQTLMN